jgi:hypothetical protein
LTAHSAHTMLELQKKHALYIVRSSDTHPIKLVVEKDGSVHDYLIKLKVKPIPKGDPQDAEIDVLMNAPSDIEFDDVQIYRQEGLKSYPRVHACSWHGHHEKDKKGTSWNDPVISLKDKNDKQLPNIDGRRVKGVVHQKDIFAFPVCRFRIPMGSNIEALAAQLDFFILPEKIPFDQFRKCTIYNVYYEFADIFVFCPLSLCGGIDPTHQGMLLPYGESKIIHIRFNIDNMWWDAFVRCKYCKYPNIEFGVRFYATCNPIGFAMNRGFSPPAHGLPSEKDQPAKKQTFRELHREEMRDLGLL